MWHYCVESTHISTNPYPYPSSQWMLLPAIASGLTSFGLVYLVFRSRIPRHVRIKHPVLHSLTLLCLSASGISHAGGSYAVKLQRPRSAVYGVVCLFTCLLLLRYCIQIRRHLFCSPAIQTLFSSHILHCILKYFTVPSRILHCLLLLVYLVCPTRCICPSTW